MSSTSSKIKQPPALDPGSLEVRLNQHPEFKAKIEELLSVVENAQGDVKTAHQAEQRVIEEIQKLGQMALQGWATRQHQQQSAEFVEHHREVHRARQKNSTGTPDSA